MIYLCRYTNYKLKKGFLYTIFVYKYRFKNNSGIMNAIQHNDRYDNYAVLINLCYIDK